MNRAKELVNLLEKDEESIDLKQVAKAFIIEHPYPEDKVLHDYCDKLGISPHDFETAIYALLSDYIKKEG
jgi:hypothetical protein